MRLSPLAVVLILSPACSFWAVRGPDHSLGGGNCTTSVAAPVVDGVLAAGFVGLGVAGLSDRGCTGQAWCFDFTGVSHGVGAGSLAVAAVETAAVVYGSVKIQQCREAKKELIMPAAVPGQPAPGPFAESETTAL